MQTTAAVDLSGLQQLLVINPQTAYAAAGLRNAPYFLACVRWHVSTRWIPICI